ncbi:hypothetical protein [Flaviflagellibacter deserti]|uniref:Uncharacterized protein n=1 Tax=Flaviflagellibacter deserti TaxID=2267266 RepID=A0ABV9Z2D6_9HYPH
MAHWIKAKTTTGSEITINLDKVVFMIKVKSGQKNASQIQYGSDNGQMLGANIVMGSPEELLALPRVA